GERRNPGLGQKGLESRGNRTVLDILGLRERGPAGGSGLRHSLGTELFEQEELLGEGLSAEERARRAFRRDVRSSTPFNRSEGEGHGRGRKDDMAPGPGFAHEAVEGYVAEVEIRGSFRNAEGDPSCRVVREHGANGSP